MNSSDVSNAGDTSNDSSLHEEHRRWYPIASVHDLPPRHVFQGQLLGRELALWQADDGNINVWEDRCLHRGVRLSIGRNDGAELMCQYHGWRYANRTGACTYVPAHPADAPAQTICTRTLPTQVRYGMVWSGEQAEAEPPSIEQLEGVNSTVLRALPFAATAKHVRERLRDFVFLPSGFQHTDEVPVITTTDVGALGVALAATVGEMTDIAVLLVQPVDSDRSVVRPVLVTSTSTAADIDLLTYHTRALEDFRVEVETEAAQRDLPAPISPVFIPLADAIKARADERSAPLRVQVTKKAATATGVMAFELSPLGGPLPGFQAGAHIDVHLPNGLVRQYSITNGTGDTGAYVLGVKLEPESTGGSSCLHDTVSEGDVLAISEPHNNFTLRRDAVHTMLIAGGIGITPLLSMAKTMARSGLSWDLHAFVQNLDHVAFADDLDDLGDCVHLHLGLNPTETGSALTNLLATVIKDSHVYLCGPAPMLSAARKAAADAGWADKAVHFEYFKNPGEIDDTSSFEIHLARSAQTLAVGTGESILHVLRENGISVPSSCEQGACGTCVVPLLDGIADHQDVYLNDTERAAGNRLMTCVSRARSDSLTLDI